MAQPGNFTPILLYGSSTPGNVPLAANLTNSATGSEIAINVADKNLFFKDSGGTVNTVPIRQSSTSSNGWLSSTDWNTFNNKSNTNGTVTSVAALTLGTTGTDLSSTVANGTTTPVITLNVPTASATNRGALSAADWSTFNSKQAALVSGTNIKTVGGVTLLGSGDVGTIGVGYGGTGLTSLTASYIPYGNGTSALQTSAAFQFSGSVLTVQSAINITGSNFASQSFFGSSVNTSGVYTGLDSGGGYVLNVRDAGYIAFSTNNTERMRWFSSGGVSIGNTTDPGAGNLSVTGIVKSINTTKAWVNFNGNATINESFNVSSVTRNSVGNYTINYTNNLSTSTYVLNVNSKQSSSVQNVDFNIITLSTSSSNIACYENGSATDPTYIYVNIIGT